MNRNHIPIVTPTPVPDIAHLAEENEILSGRLKMLSEKLQETMVENFNISTQLRDTKMELEQFTSQNTVPSSFELERISEQNHHYKLMIEQLQTQLSLTESRLTELSTKNSVNTKSETKDDSYFGKSGLSGKPSTLSDPSSVLQQTTPGTPQSVLPIPGPFNKSSSRSETDSASFQSLESPANSTLTPSSYPNRIIPKFSLSNSSFYFPILGQNTYSHSLDNNYGIPQPFDFPPVLTPEIFADLEFNLNSIKIPTASFSKLQVIDDHTLSSLLFIRDNIYLWSLSSSFSPYSLVRKIFFPDRSQIVFPCDSTQSNLQYQSDHARFSALDLPEYVPIWWPLSFEKYFATEIPDSRFPSSFISAMDQLYSVKTSLESEKLEGTTTPDSILNSHLAQALDFFIYPISDFVNGTRVPSSLFSNITQSLSFIFQLLATFSSETAPSSAHFQFKSPSHSSHSSIRHKRPLLQNSNSKSVFSTDNSFVFDQNYGEPWKSFFEKKISCLSTSKTPLPIYYLLECFLRFGTQKTRKLVLNQLIELSETSLTIRMVMFTSLSTKHDSVIALLYSWTQDSASNSSLFPEIEKIFQIELETIKTVSLLIQNTDIEEEEGEYTETSNDISFTPRNEEFEFDSSRKQPSEKNEMSSKKSPTGNVIPWFIDSSLISLMNKFVKSFRMINR